MRSRSLLVAAAALLAGCGSAPAGPAAVHSATPSGTTSNAGVSHGAPCQPSAGVSASQFFSYHGRDPLTGVQFVSPSQGWVVGRHVILTTSDGGATWTVQRRGDLNLLSVDFISASVGWAIGLNMLLATTDGGRHWATLPEPCGVIRSVHFISPRVGYAIAGGIDPQYDSTLAPASGGAVVVTTNGGASWRPVAGPADPQSVCFSDAANGWLGADGNLYDSRDGGHSWRLMARGPTGNGKPGVMIVQCASGSAWALDIGPGAASSQQPHVGYHASPAGAVPLFAEQYFPHPSVRVTRDSPSAYAGPVSAISSSTAAFVDWCDVCGDGTAPWVLATGNGSTLTRKGSVGAINQASGASFLSSSLGWVVGSTRNGSKVTNCVVHTADGGSSWQVQYAES